MGPGGLFTGLSDVVIDYEIVISVILFGKWVINKKLPSRLCREVALM